MLAGCGGTVKQRLGMGAQSMSGTAPAKLQKIDFATAWLGDPKTGEVALSAQFKGCRSKAVWLPDEATAIAWHTYIRP